MKTATIGSAMIDIITIVEDQDIERLALTNADNSFLMLEQGKKIDAKNITTHVGGGAINAAVAFARQGHSVEPTVKLGMDLEGKQVKLLFEKEELSQSKILETDQSTTGRSVIIASHDRNASIFTMRGANCLITNDEISAERFKDIQLLHIAPMSNESANAFPHIAQCAKKAGAFTVANPGKRQITRLGKEFLQSAKHLDLINVNRHEAETLLPALLEQTSQADARQIEECNQTNSGLLTRGLIKDHNHCPLANFISRLQSLGPRFVLITDGTGGAYLGTPEGIYHCPILKTEVKGTAGAGDSFTSTSGLMLAAGEDAAKTLQYASINASSVVEFVDTQTGLLTPEQLSERHKKHQDTLPVTFWKWLT